MSLCLCTYLYMRVHIYLCGYLCHDIYTSFLCMWRYYVLFVKTKLYQLNFVLFQVIVKLNLIRRFKRFFILNTVFNLKNINYIRKLLWCGFINPQGKFFDEFFTQMTMDEKMNYSFQKLHNTDIQKQILYFFHNMCVPTWCYSICALEGKVRKGTTA